jgi:hypothetical protein
MRRITRRTMLKGLGAAIALPVLDAMLPHKVLASSPAQATHKRLAFFYVPNGINMAHWTPSSEGTSYTLPSILEPLKPVQSELMVLSGLTCDKARPNGDGPGDHARAMSAFLTGSQPKKTAGADIKVGISADQLVAQTIGKQTRFASLEIGCESGRQAGSCDSGYSCAYSSTVAWRTESTPVPKEVSPRLIFDRMFASPSTASSDRWGAPTPSRMAREEYQKSILDFVLEDANQLKKQLGPTDRHKMDEYLTALRDVETRIAKAEKEAAASAPKGATRPASGVPREYQEHIKLLTDLLVLAFQTDQTRVATFVYANDGSNRSYRFIDVPEGHHDTSHHQRDKEKLEKIRKINHFHITQFAYFLERMQAIKEGNRTLLDSAMVVYGSGISDGNRHNHDELPILLAGRGAGSLKPGRHIRYRRETPLTNLHLSLMNRMGVEATTFGDSKGTLNDLA